MSIEWDRPVTAGKLKFKHAEDVEGEETVLDLSVGTSRLVLVARDDFNAVVVQLSESELVKLQEYLDEALNEMRGVKFET